MIEEYPQSYIIIDALDECKDVVGLTDILEQMTRWQLDRLHLLVTSRTGREIRFSPGNPIEDQNTICLQSRLVDNDIHKYVRKRLCEDSSLRKWQNDPDVQGEIEAALMSGAHGM